MVGLFKDGIVLGMMGYIEHEKYEYMRVNETFLFNSE